MNITQERIDDLNAVVRVKITPDDFKGKYEEALKTYARKATIKGFRPGHVPMAMIKKMYGKALLAEEINRLLNDSLYNYINENKLDVLGNPLPVEDQAKMEFHENADMEFAYDLGLAPKIDLNLSREKAAYQSLLVDDALISKQIEDLRRRYGKLENAEVSDEKDMLFGNFAELDENGELKENGIHHTATISIEYLHEDDLKKKLSGLKPGDTVKLDPRKVSHGAADMAAMLGIEKEQVKNVRSQFNFTVNEIKRIVPAELNQELYDKLFGEGTVNSEEELKTKVTADLKNMFVFDSDRLFYRDITTKLIDTIPMSLPDAFLKRWIIATNDNPISNEQLDIEYPSYQKGLKWQLIENKIIRDNEIKVSHEDALEYTKQYLAAQYSRYGIPAPEEAQLNESAMRILTNKEESKRIYDELYNRKVMEFLKGAVKLEVEEIEYEAFMKVLGREHKHDHDHDDHDHDHEHDHEHEHHHHH